VRCNGSFALVRRERLEQARLYLVLDLTSATERIVRAALAGGADVVQLREKEAPDAEILLAANRLQALCHAHDALFVLNDRPDLALASGADGVHVGQDDMAVAEARAIVGADGLVGLSTHSREQLEAAAGVGADYVSVGPVWETPTKEGRPAVGLELVGHAARHAPMPFFAIGGIDGDNVLEVVAAGATRVAVVRAIRDAEDPEAVARSLRGALPA
jgi:thiamine-phosphate pyrophosphorylase